MGSPNEAGFSMAEPHVRAIQGKIDARVQAQVPMSCEQAWAVYTDFDSMPSFLPGLEHSAVLSRDGTRLFLEQSGVARYGIFTQRYHSTRELTLNEPKTILSASIPTDELPFNSTATFHATVDGCSLNYSTQVSIPEWVPTFAAVSFAKANAATMMSAMLEEMRRRYGAPVRNARNPVVSPPQPAPRHEIDRALASPALLF